MQIRIPRTTLDGPSGRAPAGYALLIQRLPRRGVIIPGRLFRAGALVDQSELWPTRSYPLVPLLVEFAGTDGLAANGKPARGHNRARDVRVLWRFDRDSKSGEPGAWDEIARVTSEGSHWYADLAPIVERELVAPAIDGMIEAREAAGRLAALIDGALDELTDEGRERAIALLYDRAAARLADLIGSTAAGWRRGVMRETGREGRRSRAA